MPVNSIVYQPLASQLMAAYRPIIFRVQATTTGGDPVPPFVTMDVYIKGIYYQSQVVTVPDSFTDTFSQWSFNASGILKTFLAIDLPNINNTDLVQGTHASANMFVRFRASDVDGNNFTSDEPTAPVQGTKFTDPVAGTGLQSNSFFVINATLQHEDNQNIEVHLNSFKQGVWSENAFPQTHRKKYFFCNDSSDHYPVIYRGTCVDADITLFYRLKGTTDFLSVTAIQPSVCAASTYEVAVAGLEVTVHLDAALPAGETVQVQYKKTGDPTWLTVLNGASTQFTTQDITFMPEVSPPGGDYDIRVIHFCSACKSAAPVNDNFSIVATCDAVAFSNALPNAIAGSLYRQFLNLTGTPPFTTGAMVRPSWMTITVVGSRLLCTGTVPDTPATGLEVSVVVNNCSSDTALHDQTIDIVAASSIPIHSGYDISTDVCGLDEVIYISSIHSDIDVGVDVFTDSGLTSPLLGQNYIKNSFGQIFHINASTGRVGASTGIFC